MVWAGFQTRDVGIGPRFPLVGNLQAFGLGHLGFPRILPLQIKGCGKLVRACHTCCEAPAEPLVFAPKVTVLREAKPQHE